MNFLCFEAADPSYGIPRKFSMHRKARRVARNSIESHCLSTTQAQQM